MRCQLCGTPIVLVSSEEGTNSYRPIVIDRLKGLRMSLRQRSARATDDAIKCNSADDYERAMGKSLAFDEAVDMLNSIINALREEE